MNETIGVCATFLPSFPGQFDSVPGHVDEMEMEILHLKCTMCGEVVVEIDNVTHIGDVPTIMMLPVTSFLAASTALTEHLLHKHGGKAGHDLSDQFEQAAQRKRNSGLN